MNFERAMERAKLGFRIRREGWNGEGMWVGMVGPNEWQTFRQDTKGRHHCAFLYMVTVTGAVTPWVASQADLFAIDWQEQVSDV